MDTAQGVPPALQDIIDKIMNARNSQGGDLSGGRKVEALTRVASTLGGIEQQKMQDTSAMARLGITESGMGSRQSVTEAGAGERQRKGFEFEDKPISPFLSNLISNRGKAGGIGATASSKKTTGSYSDMFPDLMSYFQ